MALSNFPLEEWEGRLVSSNFVGLFQKSNPPPSSGQATPKLKTYKFDSGTDLKKELDSVNPQVLDSDFTERDDE